MIITSFEFVIIVLLMLEQDKRIRSFGQRNWMSPKVVIKLNAMYGLDYYLPDIVTEKAQGKITEKNPQEVTE